MASVNGSIQPVNAQRTKSRNAKLDSVFSSEENLSKRVTGASSGFLLSEISVPPGFLEIIVVLSPPDSKISVIQIPYKVLQG